MQVRMRARVHVCAYVVMNAEAACASERTWSKQTSARNKQRAVKKAPRARGKQRTVTKARLACDDRLAELVSVVRGTVATIDLDRERRRHRLGRVTVAPNALWAHVREGAQASATYFREAPTQNQQKQKQKKQEYRKKRDALPCSIHRPT
jgi:hypothetical protein